MARSVLLGVLVLGALVLSTALWLQTPGGGRPVPRQAYVADGAWGEVSLAGVAAPLRLVLHRGGSHRLLAEPSAEEFAAVWGNVREAVGQRAASPLEGPAVVGEGELEGLRRSGTGLEVLFPVEFTLGEWLQGAGSVRGGSPGDELALLAVPVQRLALFVREDGRLVAFLGGSRGRIRAVLPTGPVAGLVAEHWPSATPARELSGGWGNLKPVPGLYVMDPPEAMPLLVAAAEPLEPRPLADSLFPDPLAVQRLEGRDGSLFFTDGQEGLKVEPNGAAQYDRPQGSGRRREWSRAESMAGAVSFVAEHGGWPAGARLLAAVPVAEGGLRLEFSPYWNAYPLLGGPGRAGSRGLKGLGAPAPLEVVVAGGGVTSYARSIQRPLRPVTGQVALRPTRPLVVEDALTALDRERREPEGPDGNKLVVRDAYLAYYWQAPRAEKSPEDGRATAPASNELRPVWALEVGQGGRILVDALTGDVYP